MPAMPEIPNRAADLPGSRVTVQDKAAARAERPEFAAIPGAEALARRMEHTPAEELRQAPASDAADPRLLRIYRSYAAIAGLTVIAIGAVVLVGWLLAIPLLTQVHPDWIAMKLNAALGLIATGSGLTLVAGRRAAAAARACAAFAAALGLATLGEYLFGWNLRIDQLLIVEPADAILTAHPGRMSELTALSLVLCGLGLLALLSEPRRLARIAGTLVAPAAFLALGSLLGYVFGAEELNTIGGYLTAMAAHTSIAFFLLSSGIIACGMEHGLLGVLASAHPGGVMLRKLLPLALLTPIAIVWLELLCERAGLFRSVEFGAAIVAVAIMLTACSALLWCAHLLERLDRERLGGERAISKLDTALAERVSALEWANRELEGFSYATSHVLRAPLRAMDGFSRILLEDYADKLDAEGQRLLGVVRSNALAMGELIDEILGFLRLGREPLSVARIDMAACVRSALRQLESKTRGRALSIELAPLPDARGDAAMIERAWLNLLDNALKFTAPKAAATIEVGAQSATDATDYYVRDNGVGFDMRYSAKLFGVFNRLHGIEFAGNGMGLATVQRIVSRHGGRVWAESTPGTGATFHFSLPHEENSHGRARHRS